MRFVLSLFFGATLLQGCNQIHYEAAATETAVEAAAPAVDIMTDEAVVRFSDILAQYQQLNTRLEDVAARLQIANAALCPVTVRDPGYTVHTLLDYPSQLQPVARSLLSVDEGLSVRTVRTGSPAAAAGLQAGDKLMGVNGQRFASGRTQKIFYDRVTTSAFAAKTASLTIARDHGAGEPDIMSFDMAPQTVCGYPAHVVFDEAVNGHTDGRAVWITSELMRTVDDDVNLALIVAHEMSHAIAGDKPDSQSKTVELKADSMALVMLARAGFDIDRAIAYWSRADNPQRIVQSRSATHPSITQRLNNFEVARQAIVDAERRRETVGFSIIPEPVILESER